MPVPVPVPPDEDANDSGSDEGSEPESYFPGAEVEDPEFEELSSDDFPTYFIERGGRLFHSHGGSPYPLPVDTPEQEASPFVIVYVYPYVYLFLEDERPTSGTVRVDGRPLP
jgi:hypothetical protein